MPYYTVGLSVGFLVVWGFLFCFWVCFCLFWLVWGFFEQNVLKINSGKQNVKLDWLLLKFFIVLYALGCVLGK